MTTLAFDPARALLRLQESLDRLHRAPALGFGSLGQAGAPGASVFPPINVFLDHESLVVRAEVPGYAQENLTVTVEPRRLTVAGERTGAELAEPTHASYHRRERQLGNFSRTIQLPDDLDTDAASAECSHGLLTVRIPKRPEHRPRKVTIASA